MESHIPVLIIGAGPSGLLMGCEFARLGISFRIIDKQATLHTGSNATWIQTLTLEMLDQIGMAEQFIKKGHKCEGISVYIDGKHSGKIPLKPQNSCYPYVLMLPQAETEKLFIHYLSQHKIKIERAEELVAIEQTADTVKATVKHADGKPETIICNYLIACDGANSSVREKCNISFPGEDLKEQFVVADARMDSYVSKKEIHAFFNKEEFFGAFPLGEDLYRITANLHLPVMRKTFYEKEIIELAQERAQGEFYVKKVSWISTFWIHGKVINEMRVGNIFFAGDAAHIHSPVGGQGMNTGLHDIHNLAWKLAAVLHKQAKTSLLDSYQAERCPVIKKIVAQSNEYTRQAIEGKGFLKKLQHFLHTTAKDENVANRAAREITQLNIHYDASPVIDYQGTVHSLLMPGYHFPDFVAADGMKLYELLRNSSHNILLFTVNSEQQKWEALKTQIESAFPNRIKVHLIANNVLTEHLAIQEPLLVLLRPDNYIAYVSGQPAFASLNTFLAKYFSV